MLDFNSPAKTLVVLSCTIFCIMLCCSLTDVFVVVQFPYAKEGHFVTRSGISSEFFIKPTEEGSFKTLFLFIVNYIVLFFCSFFFNEKAYSSLHERVLCLFLVEQSTF